MVARRVHEDYLEILSAESLERTKSFFRKQAKAFKISIILAISFILFSISVGTPFYLGMALFFIYLVNYLFSILASEFILSVNEIWKKYIIYKIKNIGQLDEIREYVPKLFIRSKRLIIFVSLIVLIVIGYLNYFHYELILQVSVYLPIVIAFLSMYVLALMLREIILPSITFSRSELFRGQRETYVAQRSAVLAMTFLALTLIYISYFLSVNASEISRAFIINALYFLSGLILGKSILTWFKVLFSIKNDPITDPISFQIVPILSIIPAYFTFSYLISQFLISNTSDFSLVINAYYVSITVLYFIFMSGFIKMSMVFSPKPMLDSNNDEIEKRFHEKFFRFWLDRTHHNYNLLMKGTIIVLIIGIIIANNKALLMLQNQNELYYISITSLILGINFGFINYSTNIINYCLENLGYERNRFVKEYKRSEELSDKGERTFREDRKIEDMEDFETILRDLERILQEE